LHETADKESRDLTAEERVQFDTLLSDADALETQITTIQGERERLLTAEQKTLSAGANQAEKPQTSMATADKSMKRAEFEKLPHAERTAFMRSGGRTED
jgi:hypothetical protein